ncbi:hypothetical protein AWW72_13205 [Acinetobacter sp. NRRL B-65365]|uniref:hypothetical protein n=1 Tax=Acinetobacter sp. NRRL B-65365 TaxID=1785092 RepID=UPI0007A0DD51|nr:hypothetical protein [Acinetobacter sp. NRRL B-65365]KYQ83540.1 hypothetical protein AWW72_13205 [Acinetobacter sp. NRRL B-65365]
MKHKSIQSQTTRPCCTEPTAKDMQIPLWDHFVANLIDTLKLFAFLGTGLVLWYALTFFIHSMFWGN